jgi:dihydroorotase
MGTLVEAGAVAFSDESSPVANSELMRRALEYLLMFDKPVLNHPQVAELTADGVMHEGLVSMVLALPGIPAEAEDVMTGRDLSLAESTGGKIHMMHLSTAGSIDMIRRAKTRGVRVTAEVCPHHFSLTDETLRSFDSNFKMNPPLRDSDHLDACIAGLTDGTIDVIASDHAPHAVEKKMRELDQAPFGAISLETSLALVITNLIQPGHLDWMTALEKMTINPAQILGIAKGTLQIGSDADVTIIDPENIWTVDPEKFYSKSRNSPFIGKSLTGRAETVIVAGRVKFERGS